MRVDQKFTNDQIKEFRKWFRDLRMRITPEEINEANQLYQEIADDAKKISLKMIDLQGKLGRFHSRIRHGKWRSWISQNLAFDIHQASKIMREYGL